MNIVIPALIVIGTVLSAVGIANNGSGLAVAGIVFIAVAILTIKFTK